VKPSPIVRALLKLSVSFREELINLHFCYSRHDHRY